MPPVAVPVSPCSSQTSAVAEFVTDSSRDVEDHYDVNPHVIGAGRFGSVRACTERATGRRFAVKSVRKDDPAVTPVGLAREVELLREMNHPGILRFVDVYEDDDHVHIITDLCEGGELFDKIVDKAAHGDNGTPCFTEDDAARIMHQVLAAVANLHERGVAHRDIKPENLLFASAAAGSPVVLVDFGLARRHSTLRGTPPMSARVGTPFYLAPEILCRRYGRACDLWSAGVVAYMLLCGYPPFNGHTDEEVFASTRHDRCDFSNVAWSGVSEEGKDFVRRLLQKDPEKRMTAQQALDHPWIRRHADNNVEMSDGDRPNDSPVEVVYHRSRLDSIMLGDIETGNVGRSVLYGC